MRYKLFMSIFLIANIVIYSQAISPEITKEDISRHIYYLASEELEGRGTGTKGIEKAAQYIASELKRYGYKPLGDTGFYQYFQVITDVELVDDNYFSLLFPSKKYDIKLNEEYTPLGYSSNGDIEGELVFVGYGISAERQNYNDYANIDVNNKVVLAFTGTPMGNIPRGEFGQFASTRYKVTNARNKGAAAIIIVVMPDSSEAVKLPELDYEPMGGQAGIKVLAVKYEAIKSMLEKAGYDLKKIKEQINNTKQPNSFSLNQIKAKVAVNLKPVKNWAYNLVGMLEGNDKDKKNEFIVIGAHYDHLGIGSRNSLSFSTKPEIHYGADDNASGTSAILEIAQKIADQKDKLKRSVIVCLFSGEEMGLLGSSHFVNNSPVDLSKVTAMINMDMVGRMKPDSSLTLNGVGSSDEWRNILKEINKEFNLKLNFVDDASGGSDHSSFYRKNIPVVFFFTGIHSDYHKPTDKPELINYPGAELITKYAYLLYENLNNRNERLNFTKVKEDTTRNRRVSMRATAGIIPNFEESPDGFKISGTTEGGPAQKAGLMADDIILKIGKNEIKNIYDYMYAMQEYKGGDEVEFLVRRNGKEMVFKVVLQNR